jgi:peroxiredoxin
VQIVGVSLDDSGADREVAAFAKDKGVKYEVLFGDSSVADAYGGVRFMPQSFFIDREGKITKISIGLTSRNDLEDGIKALLAR